MKKSEHHQLLAGRLPEVNLSITEIESVLNLIAIGVMPPGLYSKAEIKHMQQTLSKFDKALSQEQKSGLS